MPSVRFLSVTTAVLFVFVLSIAALEAQPPGPKPCTSPEYRHFDFWIGEWMVEQRDGKVVGSNRIERIAGGCGLQETWTPVTGGGGRSLNAYSPQDGKWHQVWLDRSGLWMPLTGGVQKDRMVLEGRTLSPDKQVLLQRITWTPQRDGSVRQFCEYSKDEGKTWAVAFDGLYKKKSPG